MSKGAAVGKATAAKSKTGKLPEWNLADLYSGVASCAVSNFTVTGTFLRLTTLLVPIPSTMLRTCRATAAMILLSSSAFRAG